ncbi:MAG TPA: FG-GAP-like repeat-containing protein [Pseudomonadales bacterium]|nr:FG-GAP-like repeat-containing protein [Pseudomonadales bacterium]
MPHWILSRFSRLLAVALWPIGMLVAPAASAADATFTFLISANLPPGPTWLVTSNATVLLGAGVASNTTASAKLTLTVTNGNAYTLTWQQSNTCSINCIQLRYDAALQSSCTTTSCSFNVAAGTHTLEWEIFRTSLNTTAPGLKSISFSGLDQLDTQDFDNIANASDNCPNSHNVDQADYDGDGAGNACDSDDDNDGVLDIYDQFPLDPAQAGDIDNDGVDGFVDNCPAVSNTSQTDSDTDGSGNACDNDDDNDGTADAQDAFPTDPSRTTGDSNLLGKTSKNTDSFGSAMDNAGDINQDGVDDLIVGAYADSTHGTSAGAAYVLSGANGSTLFTFYGDNALDWLGRSVAGAGDVNGDGYPDLVVGAYGDDNTGDGAGSARVLSGANGAVLYTFNGQAAGDGFGIAVSGAGDVNGDGKADILVGAFQNDSTGNNAGAAYVYSGANGSLLYTFNGDSAGDNFGLAVSGIGDVNGDGHDDVAVGAPYDDNNGSLSGSVRVFSGSDGSILYTLDGDQAGDLLGSSISKAGDVDGDGRPDIIAGAYLADPNGSSAGMARVFSGANGNTLYTFTGDKSGNYFGSAVSGAGDVNHDGRADVIVGSGNGSGKARVFSGMDGSVLYSFIGDAFFGAAVCDTGDINGDGYADIAVSSTTSRAVYLFNGQGAWLDTDSDGAADTTDSDDDGDGQTDFSDLLPLDTDNDGVPNSRDLDDDNDGVPDYIDAAPLNAGINVEALLPLDGHYKGSVFRERQSLEQ